MPRVSRRAEQEMHGGGASVWAEITALGRIDGMVNLGQGFPDFPCSQAASNGAVLSLQVRTLRNFSGVRVRVQCRLPRRQEGTTSTRLSKGRRDARLLWPKCTNTNAAAHARPSPVHSVSNVRLACSYARLYPSRPLNAATEVCVMTSGTEALFCCIMALIDPGDEVVFFEPFFPWYDAQRPPGHYDTTTLTNTAPHDHQCGPRVAIERAMPVGGQVPAVHPVGGRDAKARSARAALVRSLVHRSTPSRPHATLPFTPLVLCMTGSALTVQSTHD